jgi:hypothetical protein
LLDDGRIRIRISDWRIREAQRKTSGSGTLAWTIPLMLRRWHGASGVAQQAGAWLLLPHDVRPEPGHILCPGKRHSLAHSSKCCTGTGTELWSIYLSLRTGKSATKNQRTAGIFVASPKQLSL